MIAERFQKLLKAPFFCPVNTYIKRPLNRGAFLFCLGRRRAAINLEGQAAESGFGGYFRVAGETGHDVIGEAAQSGDARRTVEQNVLDADVT